MINLILLLPNLQHKNKYKRHKLAHKQYQHLHLCQFKRKKRNYRKRQRRNKPRKPKTGFNQRSRSYSPRFKNSTAIPPPQCKKCKKCNSHSTKVENESHSRFDSLFESINNLIHEDKQKLCKDILNYLKIDENPKQDPNPNSILIMDTRKNQNNSFESFYQRELNHSNFNQDSSQNCNESNDKNIDLCISNDNQLCITDNSIINNNNNIKLKNRINDDYFNYQINHLSNSIHTSYDINNSIYYNDNNNSIHYNHSDNSSSTHSIFTIDNTINSITDKNVDINSKFIHFDQCNTINSPPTSIPPSLDTPCIPSHYVHHIYANSPDKYRGKQWPEQTTNTQANNSKWKVRIWTVKGTELSVFADTGASISACNSKFAREHYPHLIRKRKSKLPVRVANGAIINLQEYLALPVHDKHGKFRLEEQFYLIPGLKHDLLASYYLLQKLKMQFPRDAPLLTKDLTLVKTEYNHPEEKDETFGINNNWDKPRLTTKLKQTDYSKNPHFQPYPPELHQFYPIEYEYEVLNLIYKFDHTRYKPKSIVTDPYHNKIKSYNLNNYTTFKDIDINSLHSIRLNSNTKYTSSFYSTRNLIDQNDLTRDLIPSVEFNVKNDICHISNYAASPEEIEKAKKLIDERIFNKVNLDHIKEIDYTLFQRTTKLLYTTLDDLFAKNQFWSRELPKYEFKINLTDDAPDKIFIKQYPLSQEKRLIVIKTAQQNKQSGLFITDNSSPHNVPIIIILKKGKTDRLRTAYALQHLNKYTKTEQSHMPSYAYIFEQLRGKGLYSTVDAKNYFECIKLRAKDQPLCHVTTPIGEFNLTRGTYGFKNIMALAQDITNYLVRPFHKTVGFVDDIVKKHAPNATPDELYEDIYELFTRAYEIGLLFHPEKTYLFAEEIEYLGYIFNQLGVIPRPEYIQKVLQFLEPKNKKEVQQYIAVLNYIAKFLPNLARYTAVINKLVHKDVPFNWSKACQYAFDQIQLLLRQTPLLAHPTDDGEFLVQTDSSKYAISAVLYQRQFDQNTQQHEWKIIEFYSKQLDKSLIDKPIMIKECLAITYALNHWQHFLLRKKFFVDTDHKNLVSLYDSDEMKAANMKKKQMFVTMRNAIAQFNFQIAHLKGTQIPLPDYLTRDGSTAYRTAPVRLLNHKFTKPKFKSKTEKTKLEHTMNYMQHIRLNDIEYPPSLQAFELYSTPTFTNQCIKNQLNLINQINELELDLIKDRSQFTKHVPSKNHEPLNRWISKCESPQPSGSPNQNELNEITPPQQYYAIPGQIPIIYSLDELNTIKNHIHENDKINQNKEKTQNKTTKKKSVTFNLTPQTTKDTSSKPTKSILKNSPKIDYFSKSQIEKTKKLMYLYKHNIRVYDHYLYDTLDKAWTNRFHNQYQNEDTDYVTADTIAELQLYTIDNPPISDKSQNTNNKQTENYFVNEKGLRRSQRHRKPPKKFYESFAEETQETVRAKDYPHVPQQTETETENRNTHLTETQRKRNEKERKYGQTPAQTHELFRSLYSDVYRADEIDSLLSAQKLLINQQNDPICKIITDYLQRKIKIDHKKLKLLNRYYHRIYKLLLDNKFYINDKKLLCVKSDPNSHTATDRLYVPTNLIRIALKYTHKSNNFSHPGATQTQQIIKNKFYWYKWQSDCRKYVSQCPECQKSKGHKFHSRGKLAPLISHQFNDIVHLDFFGPLHGALNVLVITDNLTGYTMLIPIFGQTANDVILAIWNHWRPINGIPRRCLTDRGSGFISELNQRFYSMFGIKGLFTSGYHPQTNAKAERRVQEAKKAIRMLNTTLNGELTDKHNRKNAINSIKLLLPSIQFSLNQKPFAFCGISPHMLVRGTNLNEPIDITAALQKLAKTAKMKKFQTSQRLLQTIKHSLTTVRNLFHQHRWYYVSDMIRKFNKTKTTDKFEQGDKVMYYVGERSYPMKTVRPRFTGPFTITKRISHNTVTIFNDDTNESLTCHTEKLKKYNPDQFTPEQDYIRQMKQRQKINNEYKRKKGHKLTKLIK